VKAWWINSMFFEGTMRGLFSMLFGAGIYHFTNRISVGNASVTSAYIKRLLWLFLFGLIHFYILLWDGDILYPYALIGFVAYSFRNWKIKYLIAGSVFLMCCSTALSVQDYMKNKIAFEKSSIAETKKESKQILSSRDSIALTKWLGIVNERKPSKEKIEKDIAERQKGYISVMKYKASINPFMQSYVMSRYFFWDIFAMILLGMAFFKNDILKGERTRLFYIVLLVVGYSIGLSVNYFEAKHIMSHNFSILSMDAANITYDVGKLFTVFGHLGLIMLFISSGILNSLRLALAAVGKMALSNYIMQTIICNIIFLGFGFGLYGKLQRYELYYIVIGIWIFQLIISPLWLKYFCFGPLEWAWRSLIYWKRQPFRRG
ncbi:MAG: DUF418 domain-containing protein, partial [Chitinophagaceae bacterium]